MPDSTLPLTRCRAVSDSEAAIFQERDWVKLDHFISEAAALQMRTTLESIVEQVRVQCSSGQTSGQPAPPKSLGEAFEQYASLSVDPLTFQVASPFFHGFSHSQEMGDAGRRLLGRSVRFLTDNALIKGGKGRAGSSITRWHHDIGYGPSSPYDRPFAQLSVWIALSRVTPAHGAMRFIEPKYLTEEVRSLASNLSLEESYREFERRGIISPPLAYEPGDATAHGTVVLHSAPSNSTDEPRWAYVTTMFDAEALYTGAPNWLLDHVKGMEAGKQFVDSRFRLLAYPLG